MRYCNTPGCPMFLLLVFSKHDIGIPFLPSEPFAHTLRIVLFSITSVPYMTISKKAVHVYCEMCVTVVKPNAYNFVSEKFLFLSSGISQLILAASREFITLQLGRSLSCDK